MSGITTLSKIQFGRETVIGTAVDAADILRIEGAFLEDQREIVPIPENVGLMVDTDRAVSPSLGAALSIPDNNATFEQILHILEMGLKTVSPSQDGAGSDYIYTYDFPTTAQLTPKTYTIEGGNDQQAMVMEGVFAEEFTISGKVKEALKFTASLFGRQVANDTFTAGLTVPTVEEMLFQKCKIYTNDASSAFGTTLISNYLLGFSLSVKTGYMARYTAGGNLYYSYLKQVKPEINLELTVEHDSTAEAEITKGRALTARAIRIICEGNAVTTPGTTYSKKTAIFDLVGKYTAIPSIDDEDGSSIMNFALKGGYNTTLSTMGKIVVVNEVDTLDESVS